MSKKQDDDTWGDLNDPPSPLAKPLSANPVAVKKDPAIPYDQARTRKKTLPMPTMVEPPSSLPKVSPKSSGRADETLTMFRVKDTPLIEEPVSGIVAVVPAEKPADVSKTFPKPKADPVPYFDVVEKVRPTAYRSKTATLMGIVHEAPPMPPSPPPVMTSQALSSSTDASGSTPLVTFQAEAPPLREEESLLVVRGWRHRLILFLIRWRWTRWIARILSKHLI
jgi:hypothetical protein